MLSPTSDDGRVEITMDDIRKAAKVVDDNWED